MKILKYILIFLVPLTSFGQTETYKFDNGQISCEITQLNKTPDERRHIIYYHENGQKKEEFFDNNHFVYDTLNKWTNEGMLHSREVYTDSGYTEIHYYYKTGQILEIGNYKLVDNTNDEIIIYDSTRFDKFTSVRCISQCYERTGIWKSYHSNGAIEEEGYYLPYEFEVAYPTKLDSNNVGIPIANTSFDWPSQGIVCSTYLKDGIWNYYDENGRKLKTEQFVQGQQKPK
jgi:antitoxin component YwqK of YwqJK toxin-antitoxin module